MNKTILICSLTVAMMFLANSAIAVSDAAKVGANAGAMIFCGDKFSGNDASKYKLLKLRTFEAYDNLDSGDKVKALAMKKAAEDGDYLGDPLTESRCDSLRKMLFIKYKD